MKSRVSLLSAATVMAVSLCAQQQPSPLYQTVNCVKLQPGKTSVELRQFVDEAAIPMQQVRANAGEILTWSLLRSVIPAGDEARCDYVMSTIAENPPRVQSPEDLSTQLERAHIKMTGPDFIARRNSLTRLVATELWRPLIRVGQPQKGNFVYVNMMRELNAPEYRKFEKEVWQPMAEAWVKDGTMTGWMMAVKQLPGGTDVKYTAMSADMFPTVEAALRWSGIQTMFEKIHPGQNYQSDFIERVGKLRSLAERQLFVVQERVTKK